MALLQARELQSKYEKQMKILRDDLELRRKQELHETEERKNAHIRELMRKHRQVLLQAGLCLIRWRICQNYDTVYASIYGGSR